MILRSKRFSNTKQRKISGNFRYIMQVLDKVMVFLNFCSLHLFASFCWSKSFWEISFQIENLLSFCVDLTRISWPIFNRNKETFHRSNWKGRMFGILNILSQRQDICKSKLPIWGPPKHKVGINRLVSSVGYFLSIYMWFWGSIINFVFPYCLLWQQSEV